MHFIALLAFEAALPLMGWGFEVDGDSWPGGIKARVVMTVVTADGITRIDDGTYYPGTEPLDIRICLIDAFKDFGFVAVRGEGEKVRLYGPKGQGLRSLTFESEVWTPAYKRCPPLSK